MEGREAEDWQELHREFPGGDPALGGGNWASPVLRCLPLRKCRNGSKTGREERPSFRINPLRYRFGRNLKSMWVKNKRY